MEHTNHINSLTPNAYKAAIKPANASEFRQLHEPESWAHIYVIHLLCFSLTAPTPFVLHDGWAPCSAHSVLCFWMISAAYWCLCKQKWIIAFVFVKEWSDLGSCLDVILLLLVRHVRLSVLSIHPSMSELRLGGNLRIWGHCWVL